MMRDKMKLKLVTDSNCDLPLEFVYENQIAIMPFNYSIEGTEYLDDFGESLISRLNFFPKSLTFSALA